MAISGINGYNLYGYQNAMNMLKLSFVQNTQRQAVSPVNVLIGQLFIQRLWGYPKLFKELSVRADRA